MKVTLQSHMFPEVEFERTSIKTLLLFHHDPSPLF